MNKSIFSSTWCRKVKSVDYLYLRIMRHLYGNAPYVVSSYRDCGMLVWRRLEKGSGKNELKLIIVQRTTLKTSNL